MVTLIVAALIAGAAAGLKDTTTSAVTDAYGALKGLISRKYKVNVADLEQEPKSRNQRDAVKDSLDAAGAGRDQELTGLAEQLLAAVRENHPEVLQEMRTVGLIVRDTEAGRIEVDEVDASGNAVGAIVERTKADVLKFGKVRADGGGDSRVP